MTSKPESAVTSGDAPLSAARRRLLRGTVGAAPILMVSAPRSVMGQTARCTAASSFASINTSRPDVLVTCSGRPPDFWRAPQNGNQWPAVYTRNGNNATTFSSVFGTPKGFDANTSLLNVLEFTEATGPKALARYMVAGALNANTNRTPAQIASLPILKTIYVSYVSLDYYEPTAGIKWFSDSAVPTGAGGITPWLKSTMA